MLRHNLRTPATLLAALRQELGSNRHAAVELTCRASASLVSRPSPGQPLPWPPAARHAVHSSSGSPAPDQRPAVPPVASNAAAASKAAESDITDLVAKVALLEGAGVPPGTAWPRYAPFLCSPAHHIAVRLAFLAERGKLRHPLRLWKIICPSDAELCELHGEQLGELAAFKQRHLASPAWHQFCQLHGVQQAQPGQQA